ncbi:hypothetical protein AGABI1DRAFT_116815 [Agaricus bisporus var. burnettii JB137-S8]|uniref:Uncharacterized protein n=1 Tax=Agaricus bisporus var. burnettii (strain JB137-S8 / ATCC MYA-4627 / FGSC 10392) TaxID=597362 RepID=K5WHC1_AGABU|nr:uncharacterized protein AGABI1DRAFT_116815 [Agaricus bisporus var. burnettii JB137-S8]EKM74641.1 hypothetical protein AGABI1DRAFT_116815 [Agaricus bisporus var. burnettii JB137-S8]
MPPPTSWHGRTGAKTASSASFSSVKLKTTQSYNSSDDTIQTPSSASSSLSMMLPLTPQDEVLSNTPSMTRRGKMLYDKDKHLPPLPILKKQSGVPFPMTPSRSRTNSTTASTPTTPRPTAMAKPTSVRPLHLPQRVASVGDRPAVPVPPLHQATSSTLLRPRQGIRSIPSSKSVPKLSAMSSPVATPKPRTGTGMTYRKSSSSRGGSGIPQVPALNGLGIHTRSKTPVASKTVVGQAF